MKFQELPDDGGSLIDLLHRLPNQANALRCCPQVQGHFGARTSAPILRPPCRGKGLNVLDGFVNRSEEVIRSQVLAGKLGFVACAVDAPSALYLVRVTLA